MTKFKKSAMLLIQIFCLLNAILFMPIFAFTASAAMVSVGSGGSNGYIACPRGDGRQCIALKCTGGNQVKDCLIPNQNKAVCHDSKYNLNAAQTDACLKGINVCMCMTQDLVPPARISCKTSSDCPFCTNGVTACVNNFCAGCVSGQCAHPDASTCKNNCPANSTKVCNQDNTCGCKFNPGYCSASDISSCTKSSSCNPGCKSDDTCGCVQPTTVCSLNNYQNLINSPNTCPPCDNFGLPSNITSVQTCSPWYSSPNAPMGQNYSGYCTCMIQYTTPGSVCKCPTGLTLMYEQGGDVGDGRYIKTCGCKWNNPTWVQ